MHNIHQDSLILETLACMAVNYKALGMHHIERADNESIEAKGVRGYYLATSKGKENVTPNDITIDKTVVYTGPQGSGKTEALFGITELALSSTLWGLSFAEETKIGGNWEVLPLITIPDFKDEEAVRSYSSFEREVRNRIGLIAQYCEELPEGVRPLILMDEPLSSTNTDDASEGIRAIRDLVESKGGVLIIATHSHEAVWDMDKEVSAGGHQFDSKHVGLFDTEQAYKWLKGHGESMGIEVAKRNGMPHVAIEIAELVRDYIQLTGKKYPDISVVQAVAQNIKNVLEKYSL